MNLNYGIEGMLIKRGMVFLLDMTGMGAIGSEQGESVNGSKLRPCVCIQNDIGNKFSPTIIVALITSKTNKAKKVPTHVELHREMGLDKNSVVMLEQIKTVDKRRLKQYCCKLDRETMNEIDRAMNISLGQLNVREEDILKQVEEVKYWDRIVTELTDDIYASHEQIKQRIIRLQIEYNKLKKMCEENRLYVNNYFIINELKYRNMLKTTERVYATV